MKRCPDAIKTRAVPLTVMTLRGMGNLGDWVHDGASGPGAPADSSAINSRARDEFMRCCLDRDNQNSSCLDNAGLSSTFKTSLLLTASPLCLAFQGDLDHENRSLRQGGRLYPRCSAIGWLECLRQAGMQERAFLLDLNTKRADRA